MLCPLCNFPSATSQHSLFISSCDNRTRFPLSRSVARIRCSFMIHAGVHAWCFVWICWFVIYTFTCNLEYKLELKANMDWIPWNITSPCNIMDGFVGSFISKDRDDDICRSVSYFYSLILKKVWISQVLLVLHEGSVRLPRRRDAALQGALPECKHCFFLTNRIIITLEIQVWGRSLLL